MRLILKLGEAGAAQIWVGPRVLQEAEAVLARKAAENKVLFALLLDLANLVGNPRASELPFPIGTPGDFLAW